MRFREQHDGTLIAPKRGRAPKPPEGYIADPGDAFHFLPVLAECEHREKRLSKSTCCGDKMLDFCTDKDQYVLYNDCQECKGTRPVPSAPQIGGQELYQALYDDNSLRYGQAKHNRCPGVRYLPKFMGHLVSPTIDLGCGTGDTVRAMQEAGLEADGADWIDLKFGNKVCDITEYQDLSHYRSAICIDVLEHVTDDKLPGLLKNLQQVDKQVVTIYAGSSKERGFSQELHTNIKTPDQWTMLLEEHFKIITIITLAPKRYLYLMERLDATQG